MRHEDFIGDLTTNSRQILDFYGLPFTNFTEDFLKSHTSRDG